MIVELPTKSDAFLNGQDILYSQFNDINFYIEDEDQENLYHQILKKQFDDIKFEKIFPLNGKKNVLDEASRNSKDKKKIYILDKDFDDIFGKQIEQANVFYLEQYGIENYLFEERAIIELIIEERPKLKASDITSSLKFAHLKDEIGCLFKPLIKNYLVIQEFELGIKNVDCSAARFCLFNPTSSLKSMELLKYEHQIENKLKILDGRYTLNAKRKKYCSHLIDEKFIPGKYVLGFLKSRIQHLFNFQLNWHSFVFRLAKLCELSSLDPLKNSITAYVKE